MINERYIFRGKIKYSEKSALRRKNGKWVQGFYRNKILADGTTACVCDYPVDPATVGQCTGLRDKHGKLIFEGDIAQDGWKCRTEVYWNQGAWLLKSDDSDTYLYDVADMCEIIGNIHDNPDLLEVTE